MPAPLDNDRARLAEHYRGLNDLELAQLAAEGAALTDLARKVLTEEISHRRLPLEVAPHSSAAADGPADPPFEIVTIRVFRDLPAALVAKGVLDEAGIESFLADENVVRMDWFWSNAVGGVKLRVKREDAAKANELLDADSDELPEDEDVKGSTEPS